ncbi:MAG: 16S rRNA (uracil(1498)-N(3))-methyltransferase [Spirochaetaceae bacterium]|nr:16S rRNA (uracil(1498)-N(3))-methyltransferase [Spirochaetaceae bacterium]
MKVFVLPPAYTGGDSLELEGEGFHYLCRVRRLRRGDSLPAMDAAGASYHLTLEEAGRKSCRFRVQKKGGLPRYKEAALTLYQCLPKGSKFDTIVRQAVELGVARIVPVKSRYAEMKMKDNDRSERWQRIAREAAQQCGADSLPEISAPLALAEVPRDFGMGGGKKLGIFFHQEPLETSSLHEYLCSCPEEIALVIGPEGGLAGEEVSALREAGFIPAYLGHRVLRSETAPVFAAAALRIILLEREKWNLAHEN